MHTQNILCGGTDSADLVCLQMSIDLERASVTMLDGHCWCQVSYYIISKFNIFSKISVPKSCSC